MAFYDQTTIDDLLSLIKKLDIENFVYTENTCDFLKSSELTIESVVPYSDTETPPNNVFDFLKSSGLNRHKELMTTWFTSLYESDDFVKNKDASYDVFIDFCFHYILPNFFGDLTCIGYYEYDDLIPLSLFKKLMCRLVGKNDTDTCFEEVYKLAKTDLVDFVDPIYKRHGGISFLSIQDVGQGLLQYLFNGIYIDLVCKEISLDDIPENLIVDFKYFMLTSVHIDLQDGCDPYFRSIFVNMAILQYIELLDVESCFDWYLELFDTYELILVGCRFYYGIVSRVEDLMKSKLLERFYSLLSESIIDNKIMCFDVERREYPKELNTLRKLYSVLNTLNNPSDTNTILSAMLSVGHSSPFVLLNLKVMTEEMSYTDETFKLDKDGPSLTYHTLPLYFECMSEYHFLLQGIKLPVDILGEQVNILNKLFHDTIEDFSSKLSILTQAFLRLKAGFTTDRKTCLDISCMLNYDFGDEDKLDEIERELDGYINIMKLDSMSLIIILMKTFYNNK